MTLLSPMWLWLLGAAPLIVVLHMRRRRAVVVPSIRLWLLVTEGNERPRRLRRPPANSSLLLQLAVLAVTALALAQPVVRSAPEPTARVLVIDAGAAMAVLNEPGGSTRFSDAVQRWLGELTANESRGPFTVWWSGPQTRPLAFELTSREALSERLAAATPSDGATDWGSLAMAMAGTLRQGSDIAVFTTEPDAAARALGEVAVEGSSQLRIVDVGGPIWDLYLEPLSVTSDAGAGEGQWSVSGAVKVLGNPETPPREVPITIGFQPLGTRSVLPFWSGTARFNVAGRALFAADLKLPGSGFLRVQIGQQPVDQVVGGQSSPSQDGDVYPGDDERWLFLDPDPALPEVVIVSSFGDSSPTARVLRALGTYAVSVSASWTPGTDAALVIVESGVDPFVGLAASDRPVDVVWIGAEPGSTAILTDVTDPSVADWNPLHPVSSGTNWGSLEVTHALRTETITGSEVLVRGVTQPLVQIRATTHGRDVVIAFDPHDGAWTESSQFLTLLADATAWLAPAPPTVASCTVGAVCRLPWLISTGGVTASLAGSETWSLPARAEGAVPSTYSDAWVPTRAGLWELRSTDGTVTYQPVEPADAVDLSILRAIEGQGEGAARSVSVPSLRPAQLLLLALIALLMGEGLSAGLTSERFWLGTVLAGPGARGRRARFVAIGQVVSVALLIAAVLQLPWPGYRDPRVLVVATGSTRTIAPSVPTSLENWPSRRTVYVPLVTADGAVDVARAMELALAAATPADDLRILLVPPSDPTRSLGTPLLATLGSEPPPVDTVLTPPPRSGDVAITRLMSDGDVSAGGSFVLQAVITSPEATSAVLRLSRDGLPLAEHRTELLPGTTLVRLPARADEPGVVRYSLTVAADGDPNGHNDEAAIVVTVNEPPRVALYAAEGDATTRFAEALTLQGFTVVYRPPHTMGNVASSFMGYDAVVLMDVPAIDLTSSQQEALEGWVRDFGGGLLLVGGEHAFGPGGYLETALDRVSPLSSRVPRDAPAVAMLFVLDRSGSMQQLVGTATRLEVAKQATLTAISLLGEGSEVAVVAYDDTAHTLLEFTDSSETVTIEAAITPLVPGGGTAVHPALVRAVELLRTVDAASRHVIVLTDGLSQPDDITSVMADLVAEDATVSAIAIGTGADVERVSQIARLGGGTAHTTTDFRALPGILAQEAMLLAGDPVVREQVAPRATSAESELLVGLPPTLPVLDSFVETTPKRAATVHLSDSDDRPLLASWRYGSGRVLAFTSQSVGGWAQEWNQVSAFPAWWGQWLRWTIQPSIQSGLEMSTAIAGDELIVVVTATADDGTALTGLNLIATATAVPGTGVDTEATTTRERTVGTSGVASTVLVEVSAGLYRGTLPLSVGETIVEVIPSRGSDEPLESVSALLAHSYMVADSGAYLVDDVYTALSRQTAGRSLSVDDEVWPTAGGGALGFTRGFRPWVLLAIVSWGLGLVARYTPATWLFGSARTRSVAERPSSTISTRV